MELTVIRYSNGADSTMGLLMINGTFAAYTLEDEYREVKVMGETRIPAGRYEVVLRNEGGHHERYKVKYKDVHKGMLHITNVPNFQWILIHVGNDDDDTAGCLLLGDQSISNVNNDGRILQSTNAYKRVYPIIANTLEMGEKVFITYLNQIPDWNGSDNEEAEEAMVATSQLNLRAAPGGRRQGVLFEDTPVDVIEERNGWSKVVTEGWLSSAYLNKS